MVIPSPLPLWRLSGVVDTKGAVGRFWKSDLFPTHVTHFPPGYFLSLLLSNCLRGRRGERKEVTFKLVNLSSSPQRLVWKRDAINLKNTVVFTF